MAEGEFTSLSYQARHIEINLGNVLAIGALSLLWVGAASWLSNYLARQTWPGVSQLAIGAQNYLHGSLFTG